MYSITVYQLHLLHKVIINDELEGCGIGRGPIKAEENDRKLRIANLQADMRTQKILT
jgi:hypothetical protein